VSENKAASGAAETGECLWTVKDVQAYLKASRSWVYRELEAGHLPHLRMQGLVRFIPDQIRHFAAQSRAPEPGRAKVLPLRAARFDRSHKSSPPSESPEKSP
jgi:predicted DNA-binding transcriptional regulator AlpA